MKIMLFLFLLSSGFMSSQSLGQERIDKLNNTVVRITIDSTNSSGTGFVCTKTGWVATNNHVVQPAFYRNPKNNQIDSVRLIKAEFRDERVVEYIVMPDYYGDEYLDGVTKDYIILIPRIKDDKEYDFLRIGKWEDVNEGDEVYTAGYPLAIRQRVISKGLFSTKWSSQEYLQLENGVLRPFKREVAWVDLTLNKGNSGGPIIRMGKKPKKDLVVGLATFLWNPYAQTSTTLANKINEYENKVDSKALTTNKVIAYVLEAVSKNSLGLSGAVPSDGIYLKLQKLNQEQQ